MDLLILDAIATNDVRLLQSFFAPESLTPELKSELQGLFYQVSISGNISAECFEVFLKHFDVNQKNPQNRTALHLSSFHGRIHLVSSLVNFQKTTCPLIIDLPTPTGCTSLYFAACKGHSKIVEMLLKLGANPNACTCQTGTTPLIVASFNGHVKTVETLLAYKASPNLKNVLGMTPMHAAALNNHKEVIELLDSGGCDASALDYMNRTAYEIIRYNITQTHFSAGAAILNHKSSCRTCESTEDATISGSNSTGFVAPRVMFTEEDKSQAVSKDDPDQNHKIKNKFKSIPKWCGGVKMSPLVVDQNTVISRATNAVDL